MSIYPQTVAAQALTDVSDTPKAVLGTEMSFKTANGVVTARYMSNAGTTTSTPAGLGVGFANGNYGFDTVKLNHATPLMNMFAGVAVGNYTTTGQYGWVVFRGPVTPVNLTASVAASTVTRLMALDSVGRWATTVSTAATDNHLAAARVLGILRTNANSFTTGAATNQIMDLMWR